MIRVWDVLAWLTVGFPLFAGGIWIKEPGLKLELVQLTIPVLALGALGLVLRLALNADLSKTSFARVFIWFWQTWSQALKGDGQKKSALKSLLAGALLVATIWALAALRRHWAFGSGAADLGIFTNAISNLVSGRGYVSSVKDGINLFADHQSPIFWALAPIFKIFPAAETLLVLQSLLLALGAIPLYYIGKQHLGSQISDSKAHWMPVALPLLYWTYLPTRNANLFDFHPEVLMLPCFLGAIAGLQSLKLSARIAGTVMLVLGLMGKESGGVVAVGLGLSWILGAAPKPSRSFCRKSGFAVALVGVAVFFFNLKVVPGLFEAKYVYHDQYARFGGGVGAILLAPFTKPELFFSSVLGKTRLEFLVGTLAPLAFAPLLNPRALLASLPGYMILFLSEGDHRVNLQYHYAIEPSVGVWFAAPLGLLRLALVWEKLPQFSRRIPLSALLLFFTLASFGRSEIYRIRFHSASPHLAWLRQELLPSIDAQVVVASGSMVPHLGTRPWAHHLPRWKLPDGSLAECVIVDSAVNNWPITTPEWEVMPSALETLGYSLQYQCRTLQVFQSATKASPCLPTPPICESP